MEWPLAVPPPFFFSFWEPMCFPLPGPAVPGSPALAEQGETPCWLSSEDRVKSKLRGRVSHAPAPPDRPPPPPPRASPLAAPPRSATPRARHPGLSRGAGGIPPCVSGGRGPGGRDFAAAAAAAAAANSGPRSPQPPDATPAGSAEPAPDLAR